MSRRNSRRLRNQQPQQTPNTPNTPPPPPPEPPRDQNPFGLSFVVGSETVKLPSEGRYYPEDSSLYGISSVEVKHLTAKEEDILANEEYIRSNTVFDKLLESIIVDRQIKPTDLLEGDKLALLAAARITGYGAEYEVNVKCPSCKTNTNFVFDLNQLISPDQQQQQLPDGVEEKDGIFEFKIFTKDLPVGIRLISGSESDYLREMSDRRKELKIQGSETLDYLNMIVEHVDGITKTEHLTRLFEVLPIRDIRKIRSVYNSVMPMPNTKQTNQCDNCGATIEREVPFTLGWFWPDTNIS